MLTRWLRVPRGGPDVEVGVAIPVGCLVPLAMLAGLGLVIRTVLRQSNVSRRQR
jgi:hypothetical protein